MGTVEGTSGEDRIDLDYTGDPDWDRVDANDAVIPGTRGNDDIIAAGAGVDIVLAGDGDDVVFGGAGDDSLRGNDGDDTLFGGTGEDTLKGGDGNDLLDGGSGADFLGGEGDADRIVAGPGDTVDGGDTGDDLDVLDLRGIGSYRIENLRPDSNGTGFDGTIVILNADGSIFDQIEFVEIEAFLDDNGPVVPGLDGTVEGTAGDDVIDRAYSGDPDGDRIDAGDAILPGAAADDDLVVAGAGDDLVRAGRGSDEVYGGDGNDRVFTNEGSDTVFGGAGQDSLYGGAESDTLFGGSGDDSLNGGGGNDLLYGGDGNDRMLGFVGQNTLYGGEGNDNINVGPPLLGGVTYPSVGDGTAFGGAGHDALFGGNTTNDVLFGGADNDVLAGLGGDDVLSGGTGDDTLTGGAGRDVLSGGADRDVIRGGTAGDAVDGGSAGDDFDTLDLTGSNVDFITYTSDDREDGIVTFLDGSRMTFAEIENVVPCFTPGTTIATPRGERMVEELRAGDRIITRDNGIQEIRWVGRKEIDGKKLVGSPHLRPILIKAGALGNGLPERDMMVSPNHRMLVSNDKTQLYFEENEVLAAAKHLVGSPGIHCVEVMRVSYIHFMFDRHEVVLSSGCWTESFQPGDYSLKGIGNSQRTEIMELFPDLKTANGVESYQAARKVLKKHEAHLLIH